MGVTVRLRNMKDMPCIMKIPELILSFTIVVISQEAGHAAAEGSAAQEAHQWGVSWGDTPASQNLGDMTAFGFLLIVLAQTVAYLCGERSMVQVTLYLCYEYRNGALNLVGSLCYLSIGSMHVKYMNGQSEGIRLTLGDTFFRLNVANAVLAILNGLVFLVDASYCIVQVIND